MGKRICSKMIIYTDNGFNIKHKYVLYSSGSGRVIYFKKYALFPVWHMHELKSITIPQPKTTIRNKEYHKRLNQSYGTKRKRW
jgi:hypothetical protein